MAPNIPPPPHSNSLDEEICVEECADNGIDESFASALKGNTGESGERIPLYRPKSPRPPKPKRPRLPANLAEFPPLYMSNPMGDPFKKLSSNYFQNVHPVSEDDDPPPRTNFLSSFLKLAADLYNNYNNGNSFFSNIPEFFKAMYEFACSYWGSSQ